MCCGDQFFGIRPGRILKARSERIRNMREHAAWGRELACSILQTALPNCACLAFHLLSPWKYMVWVNLYSKGIRSQSWASGSLFAQRAKPLSDFAIETRCFLRRGVDQLSPAFRILIQLRLI